MKEVFILGAGASKASGCTPLGNELVWDYYADCTKLKTYNRNGKPDLSKDDEEFRHYKQFLNLVEIHYPELREKGILKKYIERGDRLYHAPFSLQKEYYVDEILRVIILRNDFEGTELIRNLIYEHIVRSGIKKSNNEYNIFEQKILQNRILGEVSIISLNFDFLLREDFREAISFDYVIQFDYIDKNRQDQYKKNNPIPLIKLNGSLDWGICKICDRLSLFFAPRGKDFYLNKTCDIGCGRQIQPFIIIPHEKYREKIDELWNKAKMIISQAKKITVIGYSFPEYDTKVISLFRESMRADVEFDVVDYCQSNKNKEDEIHTFRKRYREMFQKLKKEVKINLDGFREYLHNL